tara:strand:- start:142 stop:909 length:768 start_codon:yes stop_codon:yes gene_type:complete
MKIIGIIPVRMNATRFPGKPMELICGMPMVEHCYHRTCLALGEKNVYVATCDKIISDYIQKIGGKVVITSKKHKRATTRTAEAKIKIEKKYKLKIDGVVMVQGDEPTISDKSILDTATTLLKPEINIVNVVSKIESKSEFMNKNNVKVVINNKDQAIYFSRLPVPYSIDPKLKNKNYMQTGIIGFKSKKLDEFNSMKETNLEILESVDMNRLVENNQTIHLIYSDISTISVDNKKELKMAEKKIKQDSIFIKYAK